MTHYRICALLLTAAMAAGMPVSAQDAPLPVTENVVEPAAPSPAPENVVEPSAPSPIPEIAGQKQETVLVPPDMDFKAGGTLSVMEAEWEFLKTHANDKSNEAAAAVLAQLTDWLKLYADIECADEAQLLKANLYLRLGDYKSAVTALLKHIQEYPESKFNAAARRLLSDTVEKKMDKKMKAVLGEIAKAPGPGEKAERLALFLEAFSDRAGEEFYEPAAAEFRDFFSRFPLYKGRDALQLALGKLYARNGEYVLARLAHEKLIQVYPESRLLAGAKKLLADVLAENIRDYNAAIKVYQDIAAGYPGTEDAWSAYLQLSRLAERQKRYVIAVDAYEKIIALYPDKPEAYDAFISEAGVLRDNMSKPKEAVDVLNRLADKYKGARAIEALYLAAEIARKDIENLAAEIKNYDRIAAEYPGNPQAIKAIFAAGQAFEKASNFAKAREYYSEVIKQYPHDPLAKKAQRYIVSIANK